MDDSIFNQKLIIAVGYCYYNDLESIKRGLVTFVNDVDYVFAIDGKFSMRKGSDFSTDGSTEYVKSFPNVIHAQFTGMEHDKRNIYCEMATEMDVDVLIILDSDDYVVNANWTIFRQNLENIKNSKENIHGLRDYYSGQEWTPRPIIWLRPNEIRYHKAHNIFNVNGNLVRSPPYTVPVDGISIKMGDELRNNDYLQQTDEYQKKLKDIEVPLKIALKNGELD